MTDLEALQSFDNDISQLENKIGSLYDPRLYELMKLPWIDICPDFLDVLAWLLEPPEDDLGGSIYFRELARRTYLVRFQDPSSFKIRRNWNNIDLLAISDTEKYILCIESKSFGGEHNDWLERCGQIIEDSWPEYRKNLIFLYKGENEPDVPVNWISLSLQRLIWIFSTPEVLCYPMPFDRNRSKGIKILKERIYTEAVWKKHGRAIELIERLNEDESVRYPDAEVQNFCVDILNKHRDIIQNHIMDRSYTGLDIWSIYNKRSEEESMREESKAKGVFIEDMDLSVAAYNKLKRHKISTIKEVAALTDEQLMVIFDNDRKYVEEIHEALARFPDSDKYGD